MSFVRNWRHNRGVEGPFAITSAEIPALNRVFSDAFTDRYRKDGLAGVRVPHLNPLVWRYAVADSGRGAMLWRGEDGEIVAFLVAHLSGAEGWMGPLAVDSEYQGVGLGKAIVAEGIQWLRDRQARVIGLETMPRTMDNIGFYSALGFVPTSLTVTMTLEASPATMVPTTLAALKEDERADVLVRCRDLVHALTPGYDFTREIELTAELDLGDTVLLVSDGELRAFALCHVAPLVEGRQRDELRVLKLAARDDAALEALLPVLTAYARRAGARRVSVRAQSAYARAYSLLVARGARVRWTDLRMTLRGSEELRPDEGVVFSNWEV